MVSGDNVTVTLTGGSPWGFRLTGGGSLPLQIAKIRKKSQAHAQGIQEGDAVVSINGIPVHDKSHDEAVGLIDNAGDTLTLQIYRGDPDDLGQLLASTKPHAPVLPPQAEGEVLVTSSTSTSTTDDGGRRREVQERVFVTADGDTESTTFVRREHTVTTATTSSSGDVNGNDVGGAGTGGGIGNLTARIEVSTAFESSTAPTVSVSPKPAVSPKPTVSLKPVSPVPFAVAAPPPQSVMVTFAPQPVSVHPKHDPTWVAKPTFKAVAPKLAPSVAPKPAPQPVPQGPAKPRFNAKAAAGGGAPTFSPQKFQATASAMYTPQPFGGQQQQQQQPQSLGGQPMMQVKFQQQAFSSPQQNGVGGGGGGRKPHPSPFSPMSLSSPISPAASQPFSPLSPSSASTPMFNVRNNVSEGPIVWQPNMWLPGQEPDSGPHHHQQQPVQEQQQQQQQQQHYAPPQQSKNENIEVPRRMTVKERQQMLLNQAARNNHSLSARQADPDFDAPPEEVQRMHSHRLKVFGPPVEMTVQGPYDLELVRTDSVESEGSSPTSSLHRRKKLYADSAFYEDPSHKYPTIEEQMRLCRLISNSLTSAANRRARGAKMFAKRKRKSSKWVHEGHSEWSSSGGVDVANIDDLESELDLDEGGSKQLFMFRIPNLKHRVVSPERNTKMSMKKDEFERYRLQAQKCEHRTVSPGTCFDIAADLKAHKGRGGRLFERRKNRADKFIIDESNAKMAGPKHTKLENLLGSAPLKSSKSPWQAAQEGNVDTAFHHLDDMQRLQKMNQMLKYTPPKPAPVPQPTREVQQPALRQPAAFKGPRSDLRPASTLQLLKGRDFNRYAKGWCPAGADFSDRGEAMASTQNHHHAAPQLHAAAQDYPVEHAAAPRAHQNRSVHFGDYNPRPKAWQNAADGPSSYSCPASMSASWASSDFDSMYHPHHSPAGAAAHAVYAPDELPASDL